MNTPNLPNLPSTSRLPAKSADYIDVALAVKHNHKICRNIEKRLKLCSTLAGVGFVALSVSIIGLAGTVGYTGIIKQCPVTSAPRTTTKPHTAPAPAIYAENDYSTLDVVD